MKQKQTVGLCLISKDEEDCILNCINSVKHLVDVIIVVDTGSEDATAELAAEAGAEIFHFPWNGNFAQARNYALGLMSTDWILVLDCDEVLEKVSREDFYYLLSKEEIEGYFLNVRNFIGDGHKETWDKVVRLFRNNPAYRFSGAIHEQVAGSILDINPNKALAHTSLIINHYGYLDDKLCKKNKFVRNTRIIKENLSSQADNPFLLYCLALEYYQKEDFDTGVEYLEKAIKLMHGSEGYFKDSVLKSVLGYLKLGKFNDLVKNAGKWLEVFPDEPDLLLFRGNAFFYLGNYLNAAADYEKYLQLPHSKFIPDSQVLISLGDAYNLSGIYPEAEKAYYAALCQSPEQLYPLTQIAGMIQRNNIPLEYNKLCRFTTMEHIEAISVSLFSSGEIPLETLVLLFALYQALIDNKPITAIDKLGKMSVAAITELTPYIEQEEFTEYFKTSGKEIYTLLLAINQGYDLAQFRSKDRLLRLIENLASLVIHEVCPAYLPYFSNGSKEVAHEKENINS